MDQICIHIHMSHLLVIELIKLWGLKKSPKITFGDQND
jgi:hypothetical protein